MTKIESNEAKIKNVIASLVAIPLFCMLFMFAVSMVIELAMFVADHAFYTFFIILMLSLLFYVFESGRED